MDRTASESRIGSSQEMDQLRQEMQQLRDDVRSLGGALSRVAESTKETGKERAQEEIDKLFRELTEAYDSAHERGSRTRASLEREIEDRPFTSVAGAFVIGMILGKLFSSTR